MRVDEGRKCHSTFFRKKKQACTVVGKRDKSKQAVVGDAVVSQGSTLVTAATRVLGANYLEKRGSRY